MAENFRGGVGCIAPSPGDARSHRLGRRLEPQPGERDSRRRSDRGKRVAFLRAQRHRVDDSRVAGPQCRRRPDAEILVDLGGDLGGIGCGRQRALRLDTEAQLAQNIAAQDARPGSPAELRREPGGERRFAAAAKATDRDQPRRKRQQHGLGLVEIAPRLSKSRRSIARAPPVFGHGRRHMRADDRPQ